MALLRHSSGPRASRGGDGFKGAGGVSPRRHVARGRPRLTARPRAAAQPLPSTPGASPRRGPRPDVHAGCGGRGGRGTGPHVLAPGGAPDDVTAGAVPLLDAETEGRTGNPERRAELPETVRVTRGAWPPDAPWPPAPRRSSWASALGTRWAGPLWDSGGRRPWVALPRGLRRRSPASGRGRVRYGARHGRRWHVTPRAACGCVVTRIVTTGWRRHTRCRSGHGGRRRRRHSGRRGSHDAARGHGARGLGPGSPFCPGAPRGAQWFHIPRYFLLK